MLRKNAPHKLAHGIAGWGAQSVAASEVIATIHHSIDNHVKTLDCAPHYGNGARETLLGLAILDLPIEKRKELEISTKVGRIIDPNAEEKINTDFQNANTFSQSYDYTRKGILTSFSQSQLRLNMSSVHTLYLHDMDAQTHGDKAPLRLKEFLDNGDNSGFLAFQDLKKQGKIKYAGIGSNDVKICLDLIKDGRFQIDCIMLAGCFNLLNFQALDELFPLCKQHNIKLLIAAPYCGGILSGQPGNLFYKYQHADKAILERVAKMQKICDFYKVSLPHAAMQFVHQHPQVARVVVGARTREELQLSLDYAQKPIAKIFWDALKKEGLIPESIQVASDDEDKSLGFAHFHFNALRRARGKTSVSDPLPEVRREFKAKL